MYRPLWNVNEPAPLCSDCGGQMEWVRCSECVDGYDANAPLRDCRFCGGFGGYWLCPAYTAEVAAANAEVRE